MDFTTYQFEKIRYDATKNGLFLVTFTMNGFDYRLGTGVKGKKLLIGNVSHQTRGFSDQCPLCKAPLHSCIVLSNHNEALFEHLTNHPSFRLRWLTRTGHTNA